ncbi:MAG: winged helix-turn-helix transcriptional regulator, partial [Paraprevotella sp.]|nr:winged helix-turn-helix transcriptional regulator [Paraprevotella sp.]
PTTCCTDLHIGYRGLSLDLNRKTAILDGENLILTKTEFELLRMFLENEGRVYSRAEILRKVWHDDVSVLDRTIDVNITRLRKKLNEYGKFIITRTGYGYCFDTNIK